MLALFTNALAAAGLLATVALLILIRAFGDCAAASAFKLSSVSTLYGREKNDLNQPENSPVCEGTPG
jgi:hypothetical protein